jgi:hypothetical protein
LGALGRIFHGLGKFAVFGSARSRSYAKLFWLNNNRRFGFYNETSVRRKIIRVNPRSSVVLLIRPAGRNLFFPTTLTCPAFALIRLRHLLPSDGRRNLFVGRVPGVVALRQRRANFRSAVSAFEFAEIRVRTFAFLTLFCG